MSSLNLFAFSKGVHSKTRQIPAHSPNRLKKHRKLTINHLKDRFYRGSYSFFQIRYGCGELSDKNSSKFRERTFERGIRLLKAPYFSYLFTHK